MINLLLEQLLRIVHVVFKIHLPEKILILWILIGSHLLLLNSCPTKKVNAVYLFSAGYSFEVIWHNDCYRQTAGGGQPHLHHRQSRPLLESTQWTAASHGTVIYLSSNKTKSFNLWYRAQNSHLNHRLLLRLIQSDSCCCSRFLATRGLEMSLFAKQLFLSPSAWRLQSLLQRSGKFHRRKIDQTYFAF